MMKRKMIIAVCCTVLLSALTGCQLAREDTGADRQIGLFFVATSVLMDSKNLFSEDSPRRYPGRFYVTQRTIDLDVGEFDFEGLDGYAFMPLIGPEMDGYESYGNSVVGAISDVCTYTNCVGQETHTIFSGILYLTAGNQVGAYYCFLPIYQCADGSIYASFSDGSANYLVFLAGENNETLSDTVEVSTTITEMSLSKTESISVKLSISVMFAPEKIVILQMGADSTLLSRTEFLPSALPETLAPEADTVYLIVETHKRDRTGNPIISYEAYGKDDKDIASFSTRVKGVCIKQKILIQWPRT